MKKLKILLRLLLLIIIFGPIGYFGYLNQGYFLEATSLSFSLKPHYAFEYQAPALVNAFYWSACLLLGMIVASLFGAAKTHKFKKQIKVLTFENEEKQRTIDSLQQQLEDIPQAEPSTETGDEAQDNEVQENGSTAELTLPIEGEQLDDQDNSLVSSTDELTNTATELEVAEAGTTAEQQQRPENNDTTREQKS